MNRKSKTHTPMWKFCFSTIACIFFLMAFRFAKVDYSELFSTIQLNPKAYDEVYLMHFDFCSSVTKCRDTLEVESYFKNPKKRVALIIDTLTSGRIPDYIKLDRSKIFYVNRIWLQRKGLYTEYQQKLEISRKGKFKKRIILK